MYGVTQENELRRYRQQTEELGAASGEAAAANAQVCVYLYRYM